MFTDEFLLGIVDINFEQLSLFEDTLDSHENDLVIAFNNKNVIKNAAIKAIRKSFSKEEINDMLYDLVIILNESEDIEVVIFFRALLREIPDIIKDRNNSKVSDILQLRIR